MKYRQVHLDFHTSEDIPEIGAKFSREQFQSALKAGNVNSITLFSKCHHGWSYHPTEKSEMHPNLKFDLLGEQLAAAKEIGVSTQIYVSAGLDEKMARRHPEWLIRDKNEGTTWARSFSEPGYHRMCFNSPYLDYLIEQIKEVMQKYESEGLFLDIAAVVPCYCQNCVKTMKEMGLDPYDKNNASTLAQSVYKNYVQRVRAAVDEYKKGFPVFHNGGHIVRGRRDLCMTNSHFELESLPTGDYGYEHFPLSAAYVRNFGYQYLGMTGKFHTAWGEVGGFKHPNALRYEVALNCAYGAASSIGDQLHPSGEMDMATYELIGKAYDELEKKEPYIEDTKAIADIAVFSAEAADSYYGKTQFSGDMGIMSSLSDEGVLRIMHEGKYLFDVVDAQSELDSYKLLILPDSIVLDDFLEKKISSYINAGGKVLASGRSGLCNNGQLLPQFGTSFLGEASMRPDYVRPLFPLKNLGDSSFVIYSQGYRVKETDGETIALREEPYFNRTPLHFSSHKHAPVNQETAQSAIIKTDNTVYIPWNLFEDYRTNGSLIVKEILLYTIDLMLGDEKTLFTDLPSGGIVALSRQDEKTICHMLYATPVKRGSGIEVIEDIIPLHNVHLSVKHKADVKSVYLVMADREVPFSYENGKVAITVPFIENHEIIVIS